MSKTRYRLQLKILGLPHTTNILGRKHWSIKARESRKWRAMVANTIAACDRPEYPLQHAKLTLTRFSSGSCDPDGLVSSFKAVIDGLVDAQVIADDKSVNIGMPTYLQEKCEPSAGYITIQVEEI